MRKKNTESLGEVLRQFFEENQFIKRKLAESRVISGWSQLFGSSINAYTTNLYLKGGTLYVHLSSSILRAELMMSRGKLIKSLNEHAGMDVVKEIMFK